MLRVALAVVMVTVAWLAAATPATSVSGALPKPPSASVCTPSTIRIEYFSSLGAKLGEYDAKFSSLGRTHVGDPYSFKCLWRVPDGTAEAFVVFVEITPAGVAGRIASGDCSRNRPDSPPFYHSRKRYLTVSGGNRISFQNAVGGNERILKGVLAAAEAAGVGTVCPGAKPPPPKPKPKPKPEPKPPLPPPLKQSGELFIDYRMAPRFGRPGGNGLLEYHDTPAEIRPSAWRVDFTVKRRDGKPCRGTLTLEARKAISSSSDGGCTGHAVYAREGTYTVEVALVDGATRLDGLRELVVQDWLIVGLGDSNGSGEGAPDVAAKGLVAARWQDRRCHRSANSYQAQAARAIERRDPRTSVTFVHLACSGATTVRGLLLGYEGIEPVAGPDLRPQIADMERLAGGREIDAVMVSIGVNDLRFGAMVNHCIDSDDCPNVEFPGAPGDRTLAQEIVRLRKLLPNRYARVGAALRSAGAAPDRVFLSEYFDSTRDDDATFCDPLIRIPGKGTFDGAEGKWAHDRVLVPLNAAVRAASEANGWGGPITGAYARFRRHGYCARDSWIVSLSGSFEEQLNKEGTLHSTKRGNTEQAKGASAVLRAGFYPGGRTRPPRA